MLLGVVAVPAVSLPIVIQRELNLIMFIWGKTCTRELGSNFSGSLWGGKERSFTKAGECSNFKISASFIKKAVCKMAQLKDFIKYYSNSVLPRGNPSSCVSWHRSSHMPLSCTLCWWISASNNYYYFISNLRTLKIFLMTCQDATYLLYASLVPLSYNWELPLFLLLGSLVLERGSLWGVDVPRHRGNILWNVRVDVSKKKIKKKRTEILSL